MKSTFSFTGDVQLPSSEQAERNERFFGARFGDRNGVKGRDGCADEDENPGLSQTSDPAAS